VPLQVEVVRGDDSANAVDQSGSPLQGVPLVDLTWVDPKVVRISSFYKTEAFVSKFLDKCPVLKESGHSSFFSAVPCSSTESVCLGRPGTDPPSFTCIHVFFQTYMFLFLLTSSPWTSFAVSYKRFKERFVKVVIR